MSLPRAFSSTGSSNVLQILQQAYEPAPKPVPVPVNTRKADRAQRQV
jgi:hypothetical protein